MAEKSLTQSNKTKKTVSRKTQNNFFIIIAIVLFKSGSETTEGSLLYVIDYGELNEHMRRYVRRIFFSICKRYSHEKPL